MNLNLKIPPAIVFLLFALAMWGVSRSELKFGLRSVIWATIFGVIGLGIVIAGIRTFTKEKTTINPMNPEQSSLLISNGIYSISRNPMYLGMAILLVSWSFLLRDIIAWLGIIGFVGYITYFQIKPEEEILYKKFGKTYQNYYKKVKRWI